MGFTSFVDLVRPITCRVCYSPNKQTRLRAEKWASRKLRCWLTACMRKRHGASWLIALCWLRSRPGRLLKHLQVTSAHDTIVLTRNDRSKVGIAKAAGFPVAPVRASPNRTRIAPACIYFTMKAGCVFLKPTANCCIPLAARPKNIRFDQEIFDAVKQLLVSSPCFGFQVPSLSHRGKTLPVSCN